MNFKRALSEFPKLLHRQVVSFGQFLAMATSAVFQTLSVLFIIWSLEALKRQLKSAWLVVKRSIFPGPPSILSFTPEEEFQCVYYLYGSPQCTRSPDKATRDHASDIWCTFGHCNPKDPSLRALVHEYAKLCLCKIHRGKADTGILNSIVDEWLQELQAVYEDLRSLVPSSPSPSRHETAGNPDPDAFRARLASIVGQRSSEQPLRVPGEFLEEDDDRATTDENDPSTHTAPADSPRAATPAADRPRVSSVDHSNEPGQFEIYKTKEPKSLRNTVTAHLNSEERRHGSIYVLTRRGVDGYVKIGYSKDVNSRRRSLESKCQLKLVQEYKSHCIPHCKRVELLIHTELELDGHRRESRCQSGSKCNARHQEWFEISVESAIKVVEHWVQWMENLTPYRQDGPKWRLQDEFIMAVNAVTMDGVDEGQINSFTLDSKGDSWLEEVQTPKRPSLDSVRPRRRRNNRDATAAVDRSHGEDVQMKEPSSPKALHVKSHQQNKSPTPKTPSPRPSPRPRPQTAYATPPHTSPSADSSPEPGEGVLETPTKAPYRRKSAPRSSPSSTVVASTSSMKQPTVSCASDEDNSIPVSKPIWSCPTCHRPVENMAGKLTCDSCGTKKTKPRGSGGSGNLRRKRKNAGPQELSEAIVAEAEAEAAPDPNPAPDLAIPVRQSRRSSNRRVSLPQTLPPSSNTASENTPARVTSTVAEIITIDD